MMTTGSQGKIKPIIKHMLDDDLYKFTMQQAVFHQYGIEPEVEYVFTCRGSEDLAYLIPQLKEQINALADLQLSLEEAEYLRKLGLFKEDYVLYLMGYRYKPEQVILTSKNNKLDILIRGSWLETILWEVKLLAIVSELHFLNTTDDETRNGLETQGISRLNEKIKLINGSNLPLADFGTRRRFSREWQEFVVEELSSKCPSFLGTSNVYLAMKLRIKPIGTQAHEWIMAHLGIVPNIKEAQKRALFVWLQEYGKQLSILLPPKHFGMILV